MNKKELVEKEIINFHTRIQNWFRGNVENKDKALAEILNSFHPQFSMVGAAGNSLNYESFAAWIPSAYGLFADKEVQVADIKITITSKHALSEYIEIQQADSSTTRRKSSAIFVFTNYGAQWFHLLEEWI